MEETKDVKKITICSYNVNFGFGINSQLTREAESVLQAIKNNYCDICLLQVCIYTTT